VVIAEPLAASAIAAGAAAATPASAAAADGGGAVVAAYKPSCCVLFSIPCSFTSGPRVTINMCARRTVQSARAQRDSIYSQSPRDLRTVPRTMRLNFSRSVRHIFCHSGRIDHAHRTDGH